MAKHRWILALAGSLWLATAPMSDAIAAGASNPSHPCSIYSSRAVASGCRHWGFVSPYRPRADVHVRQRAYPSRALLFPRSATVRRLYRPDALRMTQIPRPFLAGVPQPHPVYISRPCNTRWADGLACPPYSRAPGDPFVEALIQDPNARTISTLRELAIPVVPDVPPIVIINRD